LPVPDPDGDLTSADGYPALALFADRAAAVVPGFRLTAANRAAVARLCHRLDGLPLAIELAAVRMRVLGVEQLLERLDDRYRLLTAGSTAALPRHQTLRAAVDWSHELCTEQEQLVWARASVLAGGFDAETAEAVCADGERVRAYEVLEAVAGLVDKSVLGREEGPGGVRYRLLDTLRHYGLEKLRREAGEEVAARSWPAAGWSRAGRSGPSTPRSSWSPSRRAWASCSPSATRGSTCCGSWACSPAPRRT
jgi:predicted ATPase